MKKPYRKPEIYSEPLILDRPIAANCTAQREDMLLMQEFGYFTDTSNCANRFLDIQNDRFAVNIPGVDMLCYHSNVQTALTS